MEHEQVIAEEFTAPEIRERLRRAYQRLAKEAQRRATTQGLVQNAASPRTTEEQAPPENQQQTYTQLRMF